MKHSTIRILLYMAVGAISFIAVAWGLGLADRLDDTLHAAAIGALAGLVIIRSWPPDRETLRRRGGRCPRCNYDLRGELDKGCPECGWRREPSE